MREIIQRPEAIKDFQSILRMLAFEAGRPKAEEFRAAVESEYKLLCSQPNLGVARDRLMKNIRMWPIAKFSNYLIFYMITESNLEIVRLIHGARNLPTLFSPEQE